MIPIDLTLILKINERFFIAREKEKILNSHNRIAKYRYVSKTPRVHPRINNLKKKKKDVKLNFTDPDSHVITA